jgi:predicted membrane metal-binding protein
MPLNVALAALLILLGAPASLFDPSFETSFAAVVGLVALVEANSKHVNDGAQDTASSGVACANYGPSPSPTS